MIFFLIPLSITFSNPKILGFLLREKLPNLGSRKYEKFSKLQKIVGNLFDKLRKLYKS